MRKAVRFCVLAGALALTAWVGFDAPAQANHFSCDYLNGTPCSSPGVGPSPSRITAARPS